MQYDICTSIFTRIGTEVFYLVFLCLIQSQHNFHGSIFRRCSTSTYYIAIGRCSRYQQITVASTSCTSISIEFVDTRYVCSKCLCAIAFLQHHTFSYNLATFFLSNRIDGSRLIGLRRSTFYPSFFSDGCDISNSCQQSCCLSKLLVNLRNSNYECLLVDWSDLVNGISIVYVRNNNTRQTLQLSTIFRNFITNREVITNLNAVFTFNGITTCTVGSNHYILNLAEFQNLKWVKSSL